MIPRVIAGKKLYWTNLLWQCPLKKCTECTVHEFCKYDGLCLRRSYPVMHPCMVLLYYILYLCLQFWFTGWLTSSYALIYTMSSLQTGTKFPVELTSFWPWSSHAWRCHGICFYWDLRSSHLSISNYPFRLYRSYLHANYLSLVLGFNLELVHNSTFLLVGNECMHISIDPHLF
jgi:hypothetical protein